MNCPYCAEQIQDGSRQCPLCAEPLGETVSSLFTPRSAQGMYGEDPQEIADLLDAESKANQALILGLFGLFCCGIILGPLAIVYGKKANDEYRRYQRPSSTKATVGVILGILGLILHSLYYTARIAIAVM